jgi:ubiquinone/menaquinone biosynthesis C-methylase UbiE
MGFYGDQVLPRALDLAMRGSGYAQVRSRVTAGLDGEVLEIGFGSGLNYPHYPATVQRIIAVDPATGGRRLAARHTAGGVPVEFRGRDAQLLPAKDESVDHVVSTWTLCTVPDPGQALEEIYRVLRPGGTLRFAEHGLAPDPKVARFQHRLTPLQRRLVGGCHLDRPISELIAGSGLELSHLDTYYLAWPRAFSYTFEGAATKRVAA